MLFQQAPSKSKSTPAKSAKAKKTKPVRKSGSNSTIPLIVVCLSVLALGFGIFQIYDIFQKSLDTSHIETESYNNYFDQKTIDDLRNINQNRNNVVVPEGRITPFR